MPAAAYAQKVCGIRRFISSSPTRFDPVVVIIRTNMAYNVSYRAGRVRAFFTLLGHLLEYYSGQLAYIEVFRPFEATPASPYGRMFSTAPELDARDRRRTIIVPVTEIIATCHLVPKFNQLDPGLRLDPYTDVLSIGRQFWLNHYYTHYIFLLIQHWQQRRPRPLDRLRCHRISLLELGQPFKQTLARRSWIKAEHAWLNLLPTRNRLYLIFFTPCVYRSYITLYIRHPQAEQRSNGYIAQGPGTVFGPLARGSVATSELPRTLWALPGTSGF
ncbi:hypothetical protein AG1IA_06866 [Rhizoctonia solani AG-1 IA]|uniref:Uncharacterized protein n=1 Tax=Thanatephorus cucumeris (strain AG1-IA) TaxID=983506 RepID=L8WMB8_THACA|nr:hypothetical protein AG1IA_06866 [Rhizoctonia solani AG-1 IA]